MLSRIKLDSNGVLTLSSYIFLVAKYIHYCYGGLNIISIAT